MASSSGASSGSSAQLNSGSGSEEDLKQLMDQRKRKRMISNRESARRSRLRKQKHLDDLMAQVAQLRKENSQIVTSVNVTTQHYVNVEAENSVLRAQAAELSHRLDSLNEIIGFMGGFGADQEPANGFDQSADDGLFMYDSWSYMMSSQPIMASADNTMLQY